MLQSFFVTIALPVRIYQFLRIEHYILTGLMLIISSNVFALDYHLPNDEWRLISLPATPPENANTVEAIISDDIFAADATAGYGEKWVLFSYDRVSNKYHKLTFSEVLDPGQGYWIIQKTGQDINLDLPAGSVNTVNKNVEVNLTPVRGSQAVQWNLVGNPFAVPKKLSEFSVKTNTGPCSNPECSLDNAKSEKIVHNVVWRYSGSAFESIESGQTLNIWDGFWIVALPQSKGLTRLSLVSLATENPEYKVNSAQEASAFLSRATFGATAEEIESLVALGDYEKWLEAQFAQDPSFHLNWAKTHAKGVKGVGDLNDNPGDWHQYYKGTSLLQRDAWWDIAVNGADQLRQRVAFALSEIMVISRVGLLNQYPDARMSYYDILVKNAFGNFETLLHDITYHPAMGVYLSYRNNRKAEGEKHPDENFAREVMELFTIGLYKLNPDGTQQLDATGKPLQTYGQKDIEEMAKVFTGLIDRVGYFYSPGAEAHITRTGTLFGWYKWHDYSEKHILGLTIPAAVGTRGDIERALHRLSTHQNTGPFIARRLIQRLVKSNPSPGYIQRVAMVFNDNGEGVRGDLKAVIKAILLDDEAFSGAKNQTQSSGKYREPLLFFSHLFRAFHAKKSMHILSQNGKNLYQYRSYNFNGTGKTKQEGPLEALTVFNYYTPDDAPWALKQQGLFAPELELYGIHGIHEVLMGLINKDGPIYRNHNITAELQLDTEISLLSANKYDELLDHLDLVLTGGVMSDVTKNAIKDYILEHEDIEDSQLTRYVISLAMTSPDYALQQ